MTGERRYDPPPLLAHLSSQECKELVVLLLGAFGLVWETVTSGEPQPVLTGAYAAMVTAGAGIGAVRIVSTHKADSRERIEESRAKERP